MVRERSKKILKQGGVIILSLFFLFIVLNFFFPIKLEEINYGKQVLSSDSVLVNAYLNTEDKWRLRANIEEVNAEFLKTIIYKEDKWFYYHPGFNPIAMLRAFYQNVFTGRRVSGASTITMQVARMMEPKERTYLSKLIEVLRAVQLELLYSKRSILEAYINLLPYGGNIEGVKAASYIYFDRPPSKLSISQSVILTIVPNDPNDLRPDRKNEDLIKNRDIWLVRMLDEGLIDTLEYENALIEKISGSRYNIPSGAEHFSRRLVSSSTGDEIYTYLDGGIQQKIELRLKNYVSSINTKGIFNGAVLVVDNVNHSVVAYVGSQDFADNSHAGEVDGVYAVRSPGSTLKPVLYASAIENYGFTPARKLNDIPKDFGGYSPENYDATFNGEVRFDYALKNSLNVPAVELLEYTGFGNFIKLLGDAGFETITNQKEKLGLSVILGGCGTNLFELTRVFSVFANGGKYNEINYIRDEKRAEAENLFSPETAFIIYNILRSVERPDIPNEYLYETKLPPLAWKTGTSYGRRDAWAIGFNKKYTIGVWIGNFNGRGSPFLAGAEIAVPLLFDVVNSVCYGVADLEINKPDGVKLRKVCAESGLLPNQYCENLITDYYIPGKSDSKKCDVEKLIYTCEDESIRYCTSCLPPDGYKTKIIKEYSPELKLWKSINSGKFEQTKHNPKCTRIGAGNNLRIVSPVKDYEYLVTAKGKDKISFKAVCPGSSYFSWFVNGVFTSRVKAGEVYFWIPKPGRNEIACIDDLGNASNVSIVVKEY